MPLFATMARPKPRLTVRHHTRKSSLSDDQNVCLKMTRWCMVIKLLISGLGHCQTHSVNLTPRVHHIIELIMLYIVIAVLLIAPKLNLTQINIHEKRGGKEKRYIQNKGKNVFDDDCYTLLGRKLDRNITGNEKSM